MRLALNQPQLIKKYKPTSARAVFIFIACLFLHACTHSHLIKTAEVFQTEERFELAVDYYQQALAIRPNNKNTLERLKLSTAAFDNWLLELEGFAVNAYDNDLNGKALLLYGKLAAHSDDPVINKRYESLLTDLSNYSKLYVKVTYDTDIFGNDLETGIEDFTSLTNSIPPSSTPTENEQEINFAYQQGNFSFVEHETNASNSYISGYVIIDNPEYLSLQHSLPNLRYRIRESRYDTQRYREIVRGFEHELSNLERQHNNDNNDIENTIRETRSRLNRARGKLSHYHRELNERRRQLDHDLYRMSYLPLTVQEDVYSKHVYPVIESTATLAGQLFMSKGNIVSEHNLTTASFDTYHDAQPIINLARNPLIHDSNTQLETALILEARNQARHLMREMAINYRQNLLTEANSFLASSERLEGWVLYGLSGKNGVPNSLGMKMKQQIQNEIGLGGELSISALLHPL